MTRTQIHKDNNFISAVLHYTGNQFDLISYISKMDRIFETHFKVYEFVIVNNSGKDISKINELLGGKISGNINIINLSWIHSIEDAMKSGIDMAIGDFIFEFDYLNENIQKDIILEVYQRCLSGDDIVSAIPTVSKYSFSATFYKIFNKLSFLKTSLQTESFRIVSRRAINRVYNNRHSFQYRKLLYITSGLNFSQVLDRQLSTKNAQFFSLKDRLNFGFKILIYYTNIGTRISFYISSLLFILSLIVVSYTIYSYLFKDNIQSGWTTTMLFLSLSFSGLFFLLLIISKYLEEILHESKRSISYTYKSIQKISEHKLKHDK